RCWCDSYNWAGQRKDRTCQAHSPARPEADGGHRRGGNRRSSGRRSAHRVCQKILQGSRSNAAAKAVNIISSIYSSISACWEKIDWVTCDWHLYIHCPALAKNVPCTSRCYTHLT